MPKARKQSKKACCMVSELLEDAGVNQRKVRLLQRQLLEGVMLLCQWQLDRLEELEPPQRRRRRKKVPVE